MTPKFRAWTGNEMRYDIVGFDWDESFGVHNAWLGNNIEYNADNFLMNVLLLQYTGLKDKNGVEIYEGDIVRVFDRLDGTLFEVEGHVIYEQDDCAFKIALKIYRHPLYRTKFVEYEIIGNIYENPELLKEQNK